MYKFQSNTNEIRKAVISENNIIFTCPGCGAETRAPASPLESTYRVKVRCACRYEYIVEINNRGKARKRVDLPACCTVFSRSNPEKLLERFAASGQNRLNLKKNPNARIIDLSDDGLGLLSTENQLLKKGDIINLVFSPDKSPATEIKQEYEVKNIISNRIGCSIIGDKAELKGLSAHPDQCVHEKSRLIPEG
ncbi:MAG: PilZ domain-containing protein [Proteobacteria bacterium]|nr:PilZ domain-containing protein [Pseudomonadota bacterium]MBU1738846.1 PilZ domain-containing protein [Pseudomonadota bacterium]